MDCSTPGSSVLYCLLKSFMSIQSMMLSNPSHPLPPPSFAFNLSQHQGLFQWVSSLHQVVRVLELQLQHYSFQWIFRIDFFYNWLVWSYTSKRLSRVFSSTAIQKHHFLSAQLSLWCNSQIHPWLLEKPWLWLNGPCLESDVSVSVHCLDDCSHEIKTCLLL